MAQTDKVYIDEYWVCKSNLRKRKYKLNNKMIFNHDFKGIVYANSYPVNRVEYPVPYATESIFANSDITHINKLETPYRINIGGHIFGSSHNDISKFQNIVVAKNVTYKNCKLTFRDANRSNTYNPIMDVKFIFENCKFENCIFEHNTKRIKVRSDQFSF